MNIFYLTHRLSRQFNLLLLWLRQNMCHVCPPFWDFPDLEGNFNITVIIEPLRISHVLLLYLLSVVSSVRPLFGFIFSTKDIRINLLIWWCVGTTSDEILFSSKVPSCKLAIYWVLRGQLFIYLINLPNHFSKVLLVIDQAWSDLSRYPIKLVLVWKFARNNQVCDNHP